VAHSWVCLSHCLTHSLTVAHSTVCLSHCLTHSHSQWHTVRSVCLTVSLTHTHSGTQYGLSVSLSHSLTVAHSTVCLILSHTAAHSTVCLTLSHTQWHTVRSVSLSLSLSHTHSDTVRSLHNLLSPICQADCRQMTGIRPGQVQAVRRRALTANTRLPFQSNNMRFVVDKVALVQGVPRILQLSPVSNIPPAHHTYLVIYQQCYIFPANHSLVTLHI